jgi:LuxR family maltose regulon positive regulatory protein
LLAQARSRLRVSLLMGTGDLVGARALLQAPGRVPHDRSTHVDVALASDDVATARSVLDAWHPAPDDLRAVVRHHLRRFAVLDAGGDNRAARTALTEAVAAARGDRLRWPFLEVPSALRAVRHGAVPAPWLAGDALWETAVRLWPVLHAGDALPEPLTPAERAVLVYLPGRMKNQQIAAEMYLSVNTIKTHVASIYRKLGVTERNEAVARAEELGLL